MSICVQHATVSLAITHMAEQPHLIDLWTLKPSTDSQLCDRQAREEMDALLQELSSDKPAGDAPAPMEKWGHVCYGAELWDPVQK